MCVSCLWCCGYSGYSDESQEWTVWAPLGLSWGWCSTCRANTGTARVTEGRKNSPSLRAHVQNFPGTQRCGWFFVCLVCSVLWQGFTRQNLLGRNSSWGIVCIGFFWVGRLSWLLIGLLRPWLGDLNYIRLEKAISNMSKQARVCVFVSFCFWLWIWCAPVWSSCLGFPSSKGL